MFNINSFAIRSVMKDEYQIGAEFAAMFIEQYGPIEPLNADEFGNFDDDMLEAFEVNGITDPNVVKFVEGYNSQVY